MSMIPSRISFTTCGADTSTIWYPVRSNMRSWGNVHALLKDLCHDVWRQHVYYLLSCSLENALLRNVHALLKDLHHDVQHVPIDSLLPDTLREALLRKMSTISLVTSTGTPFAFAVLGTGTSTIFCATSGTDTSTICSTMRSGMRNIDDALKDFCDDVQHGHSDSLCADALGTGMSASRITLTTCGAPILQFYPQPGNDPNPSVSPCSGTRCHTSDPLVP